MDVYVRDMERFDMHFARQYISGDCHWYTDDAGPENFGIIKDLKAGRRVVRVDYGDLIR